MKRMTVAVRDLRAGDVVITGSNDPLTVRGVDGFGGCCIVDFTDGTATAPVAAMLQVAIDRRKGGAS